MANNDTIFGKLDQILENQSAMMDSFSNANNNNEKIAQLEEEIKKLKSESQTNNLTKSNSDPRAAFRKFLKSAKKSLRWFGSESSFNRTKFAAVILSLFTMIAIVVATVISTTCFQMYSTFTLFEDIWFIFVVINIVRVVKAQQVYDIYSLERNSPFNYNTDPVGMIFLDKEKTSNKVMRILAIISAICNIICIWTPLGKGMQVPELIIELLVAALIIASSMVTRFVFVQYDIICVKGKSEETCESVSLVFMPGAKEFITEEDFKKKFKDFA